MKMQSSVGPNELAQLQSTMQAIELACSSIHMHVNPAAAEAAILSLSKSPQPYQACRFILERSQVANARFQAAAAIRDAAIREWAFLTGHDRRSLVSFCLHYVMQRASSPEGYVQSKVSAVAAQLLKRGWLDFTAIEKEAFFAEVNQAILGLHGVDVQFIGLIFLESLVSEFSPSTSSAMGLPREFHEQCRKSLELEYLKTIYSWAQAAAVSVANKIIESESEVPETRVCTAALRLMHQILNWDFRYKKNGAETAKTVDAFSAGLTDNSLLASRTEFSVVQPGPVWRDVLISSGHIGWLLGLYGAMRQKFSSKSCWIDCPVAVASRKLIVQFCSLTGTIFLSDDGKLQEHHLLLLLTGIIPWIDPPDAVSKEIESGKSESELLDGCRALLSIATVTTPIVFDWLLKSISPVGTLSLLSTLTCEVVKILMTSCMDEETWSWVARDILLDTWNALLVPIDNSENPLLPPEGINAAASVFTTIIEYELKAASASAFKEEDGSDYFQASVSAMDERLSSYALIARAAIDITIPILTRLLSERFARLYQGRGINDPTETLEELYSLLLLTGHVLADEGKGETPSIPKAILTHFLDITETEKHPVVVLSGFIIGFAEQSLNPEMRAAVFSPRLMEAIIWFLARWSSTYLMPSAESISNNNRSVHDHDLQLQQSRLCCSFCCDSTQGKLVLDLIIRISMTTLISYPGEKELQVLTCQQLLHALVRQKNVCLHVVTLDSWRQLANAFTNDRALFTLHADNQRSLAQTLVLSASGMKVEESNQYVRDLVGPMTSYLVEISDKGDLKSIASLPDVILSVSCLLERLRGACIAAEPRTQRAIYEMGFSIMNSILVLLEVYKNEVST